MSWFSLKICPLILAFILRCCLQHLLLRCSKGSTSLVPSHVLLRISLKEYLSLSPICLFIQSFIYVWIDTHFVLYIIIQYYQYFIAQIVQALTIGSFFCLVVEKPHDGFIPLRLTFNSKQAYTVKTQFKSKLKHIPKKPSNFIINE